MRKHQTLLIAGILLLASAGIAQGQAVYDVFANPVVGRTGGASELSGAVVLFPVAGDNIAGVITLRYSVPLAADFGMGTFVPTVSVTTGDAPTVEADATQGTVTITMPASGAETVTLTGVRLDLRGAVAPVTATFQGDSKAFVGGAVNVVSAIQEALVVTSKSVEILTRGANATGTAMIKEAFAGAFTADAEVLLRITGVPDKAGLVVSHAGDVGDAGGTAGNVTLNGTDIVTAGVVVAGEATLAGDGKDIDITIAFSAPDASAMESLSLGLALTATDADAGISLPLAEGTARVLATMAPDVAAAVGDTYFTQNFTPSDGSAVFAFTPASCTLLFPYAVLLPLDGWDTGLAISNPSAFTDTPLSGALTFTLYPNDGMPMSFSTDGGSPGKGLASDGSLPAGNTYSVLLSELLTGNGGFQGHIYVETDFTGCRGVGWVTDFSTVNQAYLPYFEDGLDEGAVPANNAGTTP